MTPHDAIRLFTKTLENLEKWMDKAGEHAKARSFDVDVLAKARLAPDQFDFVRQVQSGYVYHYAFAMILGVFLLITFFLHR